MADSPATIIVPVDGASNIKLEVLDFGTLRPLVSRVAPTPVAESGGMKYNATGEQFDWYDSVISGLPAGLRRGARVIAPAARGASAGLLGRDNALCETPCRSLALAYTQPFPDEVEAAFRELAGSTQEFFLRTGSILDYPGSLTLVKRLLFEEMARPDVLERAAGFAVYGNLLAGHFLGPDYLTAHRLAGAEHSYWMCHTGAREIGAEPGTPSYVARKIQAYNGLVPGTPALAYKPLGKVPANQAGKLGLGPDVLVIPGGHDTCLSHLPVVSSARKLGLAAGGAVLHLEAGSWTMAGQLGGRASLPADGYSRGIVVQGTLDGEPVVSSMYGGGRDFGCLLGLLTARWLDRDDSEPEESLLAEVLESGCFALPNFNPENHGTGPFPESDGRIIRPEFFFRNYATGRLLAQLAVAVVAAEQIELVCGESDAPVVLTAGGSRDEIFGRLVATLSGREVHVPYDTAGNPLSETTTLGAAMNGKAAVLGVHPHAIELDGLELEYHAREPYTGTLADSLRAYREKYMKAINEGR